MQCCADTMIQRDGAIVSAAAVRGRVGSGALRRRATWVVCRDSAAAVLHQHDDMGPARRASVTDATAAFHGHA